MKVILRTDIANVGRQGDIKEVSPGYARNFLLPRKMAMEATDQNLKLWNKEKVKLEKEREKIITDARALAEKVEKVSITVPVKVGEAGKLFGSVTNATIVKVLAENGFEIEKQEVLLREPIKELGAFVVEVRLHPEVIARVKVWVIEEKEGKEEAEAPAETEPENKE